MDDELNRWLDRQFDQLVKALEEQESNAGAWPDVFPFAEDDSADDASS